MQELQQRQALAAQWLAQNQAAQAQGADAAQNKKQREVYVGNLTVGVVTQDVVRELFDTVMSQILPRAAEAGPPVINIVMDGSQKFGFVELRSEELATAAINLDKMEVCGRPINVGRPKGYVEPPPGYIPSSTPVCWAPGTNALFPNMGAPSGLRPETQAAQKLALEGAQRVAAARGLQQPGYAVLPAANPYPTAAAASAAAARAASVGGGVMALPAAAAAPAAAEAPATAVLCLENLISATAAGDADEREDLEADVREACEEHGAVGDIAIPVPPSFVNGESAGVTRVFVSFAGTAAAATTASAAAKLALHGRTFDDNVVRARYVGREAMEAALRGEWPTLA